MKTEAEYISNVFCKRELQVQIAVLKRVHPSDVGGQLHNS
jgi:hypothetical protein